ncbi:hypothetical protein ACPV54_12095 [Vibrio mediterranei]
MFQVPQRVIHHKKGVTLTTRQDDPTHQCTSCYKPWFKEDLSLSLAVQLPSCPFCGANVRRLTKERPLK